MGVLGFFLSFLVSAADQYWLCDTFSVVSTSGWSNNKFLCCRCKSYMSLCRVGQTDDELMGIGFKRRRLMLEMNEREQALFRGSLCLFRDLEASDLLARDKLLMREQLRKITFYGAKESDNPTPYIDTRVHDSCVRSTWHIKEADGGNTRPDE